MRKQYLILIAILSLFLITRLYKVSEIPSSLYWDEASIGYNAYSILQTGKDEWGVDYPLHFKAFGEYKLPIYIYSAILPIKLLGLNELSVRLPSIFFSLLCVLLTYLIAKKISGNDLISLLSAFFLSISPYFFIFSRTGYEATTGLSLFLLGILVYLLSFQKPFLFILSGLSFVASLYAYNGYRILSPLVFVLLSIIFFMNNKNSIKKAVAIILCGAIIFLLGFYPIVKFASSENAISRFQAVGIENLERKKIFIAFDIAQNYLSHFNPNFLFINGDQNSRSQQPGFGQLYTYDGILLLLGLIYLWKKPGIYKLPILIVLLGVLPASVTRETPHALRSLSVIPFLSIISAYGVNSLQEKYKIYKDWFIKLIVVVYVGLFVVYFNNFLNVYSLNSVKHWQQGNEKILEKYVKVFNNYDHILISDRYSQPYIFTLFYLGINPNDFRSSAVYNTDIKKATSVVKSFGKFIFTNVDYNQLPRGKTLIFSHPTDRLDELGTKDIIYNDDGSVTFYVYENERQ